MNPQKAARRPASWQPAGMLCRVERDARLTRIIINILLSPEIEYQIRQYFGTMERTYINTNLKIQNPLFKFLQKWVDSEFCWNT